MHGVLGVVVPFGVVSMILDILVDFEIIYTFGLYSLQIIVSPGTRRKKFSHIWRGFGGVWRTLHFTTIEGPKKAPKSSQAPGTLSPAHASCLTLM